MEDRHTAYVPRWVLDALGAGRSARGCERAPAAVLITDIADFSGLTGRFAEQGPEGAERLGAVLDAYFGRMTAVVAEHGGDVVDFIGDAIVAVWRGAGTASDEVRAAVSCALDLQRVLPTVVEATGLPLAQRIAVDAGELTFCIAGGADGRRHALVAGAPLAEAASAYHDGNAGEVILCARAAAAVGERFSGRALAGGRLALSLAAAAVERSARAPASLPNLPASVVAPFLPPLAAQHAVRTTTPWPGEFRTVSTAFVRFPVLDLTTPRGPAELQEAVATVQRWLDEFQGSFERLSMDDKGVTALTVFGLPHMAHEDDATRAARAAMAIQRELDGAGIAVAVGVTRGRVFYGDAGSTLRRHFGLVGDAVNRAARLMMGVGTGIACDEDSVRAAGRSVRFEPLPPLALKGRTASVAVHAPREALSRATLDFEGGMADRHAARARLEAAIAQLAQGLAGYTVVAGEAGIGKSRLLAEAIRLARLRGIAVFECAGAAIEAATPYYPWRRLLRQLLGSEGSFDPAAAVRALTTRLAGEPRLSSWLPLLGDVLPLGLPDTGITREITGQARATCIQQLFTFLLREATSTRPALLVVDDLHWFDEASAALIGRLMHEPSGLRVLILAGTRPLHEVTATLAQVLREAEASTVALDALPREEMSEFIALKLGGAVPPEELVEFVYSRAGGHSLYSEELLLALRDAGLISVEAGHCRLTDNFGEALLAALPDTLEGVIVSHFDRLDDAAQQLLKAASVVGREFPLSLLGALAPDLADGVDVVMQRAVEQQLVIALAGSGGPVYAFRHAILRDVIYGLLPFAQRRALHAEAARWIEQRHAEELDVHSAELAHHWEIAADTGKALDYLERAALRANRQYSNREATGFLRRGYALSQRQGLSLDDARVARWEQLLGEAHHELFEYGVAPAHLARSLALLGRPVAAPSAGRALRLLGSLAQHGLMRLGIGRGRAGAPVDTLARSSRIHALLAESSYYRCDLVAMLQHTVESMNLAERAGSTRELVGGLATMAGTFLTLGLTRLSEYYQRRSLAVARGGGQRGDLAFASEVGAVYWIIRARWFHYPELAREAATLYRQLGAEVRWQQTKTLVYHAFALRGLLAEAEAALDEARAALGRDAPVQVRCWITCVEMHLALARGLPAPTLIERLAAAGEASELFHSDRLRCRGLSALAWWRLGDSRRALAEVDAALALLVQAPPTTFPAYDALSAVAEVCMTASASAAAGDRARLLAQAGTACRALRRFTMLAPLSVPRALLIDARYTALCGRGARAQRLGRKALAAAQGLDMPLDAGLALLDLGRRAAGEEARDALEQAREIFTRLGASYYAAQAQAALAPPTSPALEAA